MTEGSFSATPRNNVTYTPSALADGQWYWQVKAIDDEGLPSAWTTATLGFNIVTNSIPSAPTLDNHNDGTSSTDTTPTLQFDLSDPDDSEEGENLKYQIQIDNNADFSSAEIDFTEADFSASPRNDVPFTTTPLAGGRYYWQVKAFDDEGLASEWATASTGFVIDNALPVSKILYPQNNGVLKGVNLIAGESTDSGGVDFTRISIQDTSSGFYYNGTDFNTTTETWLTTTAVNDNATTTRWSYTAPSWDHSHIYTIRSRATDLARNEEHTDAITFTYDTVNGVDGSIYISNPAVMNNSDYKIYYPNG